MLRLPAIRAPSCAKPQFSNDANGTSRHRATLERIRSSPDSPGSPTPDGRNARRTMPV